MFAFIFIHFTNYWVIVSQSHIRDNSSPSVLKSDVNSRWERGGIQIDWEGDLIRRHFVCISPGNNITSVKTTNHQKSFIRNTCGWKSINFLEFLISIIFFPFSIQAETWFFVTKNLVTELRVFLILILHVSKKKARLVTHLKSKIKIHYKYL